MRSSRGPYDLEAAHVRAEQHAPVPRRYQLFNDFGAVEGDRTITLQWAPQSAESEALIARLVRLYPRVRLSCKNGLYLAAPESYKTTPTQSTLTLLVAEKLTA